VSGGGRVRGKNMRVKVGRRAEEYGGGEGGIELVREVGGGRVGERG